MNEEANKIATVGSGSNPLLTKIETMSPIDLMKISGINFNESQSLDEDEIYKIKEE